MAHLIKGLIISSQAAAMGLIVKIFLVYPRSVVYNRVGVNRGQTEWSRVGQVYWRDRFEARHKNTHNFILQLPVKRPSIRPARRRALPSPSFCNTEFQNPTTVIIFNLCSVTLQVEDEG